MAPPDEGLYTLTMRGEKHAYLLRGSEQHALRELCTTLSDITGYKYEHLHDERLNKMRIGEDRTVAPANNIGSTPRFVIKRVG